MLLALGIQSTPSPPRSRFDFQMLLASSRLIWALPTFTRLHVFGFSTFRLFAFSGLFGTFRDFSTFRNFSDFSREALVQIHFLTFRLFVFLLGGGGVRKVENPKSPEKSKSQKAEDFLTFRFCFLNLCLIERTGACVLRNPEP